MLLFTANKEEEKEENGHFISSETGQVQLFDEGRPTN